MNTQDWFPLRLTGLISLQSKGLKNLLQYHNPKASVLQLSAFFMAQLSHAYITSGKTMVLTIQNFVNEVMSLLFNTLSTIVIAFLPRSKHLLISWVQSPSAVILMPKKIKSVTVSTFVSFYMSCVMGLDAMILVVFNIEFQASFFTLLFHPHQDVL